MTRILISGGLFFLLLSWTGPDYSVWSMLGAYCLGGFLTLGNRIHITIQRITLENPEKPGDNPPPSA